MSNVYLGNNCWIYFELLLLVNKKTRGMRIEIKGVVESPERLKRTGFVLE